MGFVLLGVFVWNELALQGVVLQILCHGISTGALFILVGALQERIHTRDMRRMGGLWAAVPRLAGVAMIFALASLGLPGLGNFVSEILILFGTYRDSVAAAVLATIGLISATIYALWMIQAAFHGPAKEGWKLPDLSGREAAVMGAMIAAILWLGLYPQPVFKTITPALHHLEQTAVRRQIAARPPGQAVVLSKTGRRLSAQSVWPKGGNP